MNFTFHLICCTACGFKLLSSISFLGQCICLGLAVARGFEAFGANGPKFGLGGLYLGAERGIGVQSSDSSSPHETSLDYIAVPVDITDVAAFTEGPAADKDRIGPLRGNLT